MWYYWKKNGLEAVVQRCSVKKVFLEISQHGWENNCARVSFLIKLQAWDLQTLLKKRLWHRCFPVKFFARNLPEDLNSAISPSIPQVSHLQILLSPATLSLFFFRFRFPLAPVISGDNNSSSFVLEVGDEIVSSNVNSGLLRVRRPPAI